MPGTREPSYGERKANRTGLIFTVLLHLLVVAIYFLQPNPEKHAKPPERAAMVWVAPLPAGKPKATPREQAPPKSVKSPKPTKPQRVEMKRLPNTITLPKETPVQEAVKEEPKKVEQPAPPEMDMAAAIAARRAQRGQPTPSDSPAESDDARANRIAMANIAAANGKSQGDDRNDSGGVFSLSNRTFHSADLKFRGWNPNFKRRWLTSVTVEQGTERDLETAIVNKMIELIRKEKTGDFEWDSHRLQRVVTLSARPADTAALQAFLFKEMFPEYKPRG